MDVITVMEPHTRSISEIATWSRSISMVFFSPLGTQYKEIIRDDTTIDYERFYEDRYFKRSHKRLREGLLEISTLYEERLKPGLQGIENVYKKMLWGDDEYLLSDSGVEPKKRTDLPAQSTVNMEPENNSNEVPLQSVSVESDNNSSEVPEESVNVDEGNPSGNLAFENLHTMTSGEEIDGPHEEVGDDPQGEPEESDDHYVATEKSGDGTIIHLICTCGSRYQTLVTDSRCYLMLIPLGDDTGYDHAKLVWACKCPTGLHIGLDCPCGHGFVLKKCGAKFFYALS